MSGIFTDERRPMNRRSFFADTMGYQGEHDESREVWKRSRIQYPDLFERATDRDSRPVLDSVTSYRSTKEEASDQNIGQMFRDNKGVAFNTADNGHEFATSKYYVTNNVTPFFNGSGRFTYSGGASEWGYRGPLVLAGLPFNIASAFGGLGTMGFVRDKNDIPASLGTKAIASVSPVKSNANLTTALLELKDGFPKMMGKGLKNNFKNNPSKSVGSEYLNLMFGWVPTLSDIREIAIAMVNAQKIISQHSRDTDRIVRRRYYFPTETETKMGKETFYASDNIQLFVQNPPTWASNYPIGRFGVEGLSTRSRRLPVSLVQQKTTKTWFSGAFRYHLNSDPGAFGRMERTAQVANKWLGIRADLDTFWQLMPWSWFIDWFVDVGDLISNAQAQLDGQLLQYGYLMRTTTYKRTFTTDEPITFNGREIGHLSTSFVSQHKRRVQATPFGFGIDPESFSGSQWAILGALGMTKAPRTLR